MGECIRGARRGMGPSICARIAEIMLGRSLLQQGLAATCKDHLEEPIGKAGWSIWDWHMSPYERRREGNSFRGGARRHPWRGNASKGRRGSRRLVGVVYGNVEGHRAHKHVFRSDAESWIKPAGQGVYASQRLSFGEAGKGPRGTEAKVANRTREIRPSGMKTGASGNVTRGAGLRPMSKGMDKPPDPTVRAPGIYPNKPTVRDRRGARGNVTHAEL
jgi:hypothetical protein